MGCIHGLWFVSDENTGMCQYARVHWAGLALRSLCNQVYSGLPTPQPPASTSHWLSNAMRCHDPMLYEYQSWHLFGLVVEFPQVGF